MSDDASQDTRPLAAAKLGETDRGLDETDAQTTDTSRSEALRTADAAKERAARTADAAKERAARTANAAKERAANTADTVKRELQRTRETAKRESERTKESLADARDQLRRAMDSALGPPAEDEQQAERQIAELRRQIERDLEVLRSRAPDVERIRESAKKTGLVVGGGAVMLLGLAAMRRRSAARQAAEARTHAQAVALARELARLSPEDVSERDGGRRPRFWFLLAAVGAVAGVLLQRRSAVRSELRLGDEPGTEQPASSTVEVTIEEPRDVSSRPS